MGIGWLWGDFWVTLNWTEHAELGVYIHRSLNRIREGPENHARHFSLHKQDQLYLYYSQHFCLACSWKDWHQRKPHNLLAEQAFSGCQSPGAVWILFLAVPFTSFPKSYLSTPEEVENQFYSNVPVLHNSPETHESFFNSIAEFSKLIVTNIAGLPFC